jgi:hypothetical protein
MIASILHKYEQGATRNLILNVCELIHIIYICMYIGHMCHVCMRMYHVTCTYTLTRIYVNIAYIYMLPYV